MFDNSSIDLKGAHQVLKHGEYLILKGNDFWVCKIDGTTVLRYRNMPYIDNKVAFLPQDKLLICGARKTTYRLLCLKTGQEIWSVLPLKKYWLGGSRFAVSYDSRYAYDEFSYKDSRYIARIDLQSGEVRETKLGPGYRAVDDIICSKDSDGLYLLRSQIDEAGDRNIGRNQIQRLTFSSPCHYETVCQWETAGHGDCVAHRFLGDCETVVSTGLSVFNSKTGETYSLVENEPGWTKPGLGPHKYWFDASNRYVCVAYDNVNVIIDWENRKMVARYAVKFGRGCLIGDTYWVPSGDKVEKKPFPLIEDIPKRKLSTF